jgi:phospholipid/cholesterol/gamma-HCH transport system permease protein
VLNFVQSTGRGAIDVVATFGSMCLFFVQMVRGLIPALMRPSLIIKQVYVVGVQTLVIIVVSGVFVGLVFGLQIFVNFVRYGAESQTGLVVALTLIRELGPVFTGIVFAGRAGSALAAEIGLMKTTEQLDAMEMMAVDPITRVVLPRFIAGVISMPLLAAIFMAVGIYGASFVSINALGLDSGVFWAAMRPIEFYADVVMGLTKAFVFAVLVTWVALYQGYSAQTTSEGVSNATTKTVVVSVLTIVAVNFVLTSIMFV